MSCRGFALFSACVVNARSQQTNSNNSLATSTTSSTTSPAIDNYAPPSSSSNDTTTSAASSMLLYTAKASTSAAASPTTTPAGSAPSNTGSWLNPRIQVDVCRRLDYPHNIVMKYMGDCSIYPTWWPKTYDFTVVKCSPTAVGTVIHFNSLFGTYQTEVTKFNELEMDLRYSGEIFEGTQKWTVTPFADETCELCYKVDLAPLTYKTKLAARVSSRDYLASYFEPLVNSLVKELDRQHAVNVAEREEYAAHVRQQTENARQLQVQIDQQEQLRLKNDMMQQRLQQNQQQPRQLQQQQRQHRTEQQQSQPQPHSLPPSKFTVPRAATTNEQQPRLEDTVDSMTSLYHEQTAAGQQRQRLQPYLSEQKDPNHQHQHELEHQHQHQQHHEQPSHVKSSSSSSSSNSAVKSRSTTATYSTIQKVNSKHSTTNNDNVNK